MKTRESSSAQVAEEAARWVVVLDGEVTERLNAEFADWAAQSAQHVQKFLQASAVYERLKRPVVSENLELGGLLPRITTPARVLQSRVATLVREPRLWGGIALCALIAIAVLLPMRPAPVLLSTGVGEKQVFHLSDGSTVNLNSASQAEATFTPRRRDVTLLQGAGFFDVEHDRARPFTVSTSHAAFEAVGTEFGVLREDRGSTVIVRRGRVQVSRECSLNGGNASMDAITIGENEEAVVSSSGCEITHDLLRPEDVKRRLGWTNREKIDLNGMTLREAVKQMNGYNRRQIVLGDPSLEELQVGGTADPGDVRGFIVALQPLGIEVASPNTLDDDSSEIRLIRDVCSTPGARCTKNDQSGSR